MSHNHIGVKTPRRCNREADSRDVSQGFPDDAIEVR